ncbi:MAG TPA: hypothetical protein VGM75_20200 [Pseudonocardiaceae bacterium]
MPPETTADTLELPPAPERPADRYTVRRDRCVVEVSLRPLGIRLLRARLRARAGDLVVSGGEPAVASIQLDLLARPIRLAPLAAMVLRGVPRRRRLTFTAVDVDLPTGSHWTTIDGAVTVPESAGRPWSLPLTVRAVPGDEATILLAARGPIRPPETVRGWFAGVARWLWLDAAVEFAR